MTSLFGTRQAVSFRRPAHVLWRKDTRSVLAEAVDSSGRHCSSSSRNGCAPSSFGKHKICKVAIPLQLQRHWTHLGCRSFYTTTVESCDVIKVVREKNVLDVASHEARSLSAIAVRGLGSEKDDSACSPNNNVTDAVAAARALLSLTFPTKPLMEEINRRCPNSDEQVSSLHRAFLAVTSWCLTLLPADESLLTWALDIAHRAGELSLPLHLPLYQNLAVAVAEYYSGDDTRADVILTVSRWAYEALDVPIRSSFFSEPLVSLINRNQLREANTLMKGIKAQHDIDYLDYDTTMNMMDMLKNSADVEEDADAMELYLMLSKSMIRETEFPKGPKSSAGQEVKSLEDTVASLVEAERTLEEMTELAERLTSDEEDEDGRLAALMETILAGSGNSNDLQSVVEELIDAVKGKGTSLSSRAAKGTSLSSRAAKGTSLSSRAADADANVVSEPVKVTPVGGSLERISNTPDESSDEERSSGASDDEVHDLAKEFVYSRDSTLWSFPDVTEQLISLNNGREVRYTSQYESKILTSMGENDGDELDRNNPW